MSCRIVNRSLEEVSRVFMHKGLIFPKLLNQTVEESRERLKWLRDNVKKKEETYILHDTPIKERTSSYAKKKLGRTSESISPNNVIMREGGTKVHDVMGQLIDNIHNKVGNFSDIKKMAMSGEYSMPESAFNQLVKLAKHIIEFAKVQQEKIDPKGKFEIHAEQFLVSARNNRGGTEDIIITYSDNTASLFDFKTKAGIGKVRYSGDAVSVDGELFSQADYQTYELTQSDYKKMLIEEVGISSVRHNRLIPILVRYNEKDATDKEVGDTLKPSIRSIFTGEDVSEYLKDIPIGGEISNYEGINKLLTKQLILRQKLYDQLKGKGLTADERSQLQKKIAAINKAIKKTLIDGDISEILNNVRDAVNAAVLRIKEPELLDNNDKNPAYLTDQELELFYKELEIYDNIADETHIYYKDMKEEFPDKYKLLNGQFRVIKPALESILIELRMQRNSRILEKIDDMYKDKEGNMMPVEELNFAQRTFIEFSDINNPYFKTAWKMIQNAQYDTRQDIKKLSNRVHEAQENLFKWASANGMTKRQAFDMLIDYKTGNLRRKIKAEFWEERKKRVENKDTKWIKERWELKDKDKWLKRYKERLEVAKLQFKTQANNFEPEYDANGELKISAEQRKREYEYNLERWIKQNDLIGSEDAWLNKYNYHSDALTLKQKYSEENYTDEYKQIKNNKPVFEFYEMWTDYMDQFARMLGISDYSKLPHEFIPNIRKEMIEYLTEDGVHLSAALRELKDSLNTREEDIYIGKVDETTGEMKKNIPILFINPLRRADGTIDNNLKTYDIGESLVLFGKMAYNYRHMSDIETDLMRVKDLIGNPTSEHGGIEVTDKMGKKVKGMLGEWLTKQGLTTETYGLFEKFLNYYLYGIKFTEKSLLKSKDTTHLLMEAKQFRSRTALAFAFIPAGSALLAGRAALHFEGKKGTSFTTEQELAAERLLLGNTKKYIGMAYYFDAYSENLTDRLASDLSISKAKKLSKDRNLFYLLRKADEKLTDRVLIAMAQNYAVTEDGDIVRLNRQGVDASKYKGKTILDLTVEDAKGNWSVKGLSKEGHIRFRDAVKKTMAGIIGNMSADDIAGHDLTVIGSLMTQFRTWMPGVVREQAGGLRWDDDIQAFRWGRLKAYFSEWGMNEKDAEAGFQLGKFIGTVLVPQMAKLTLELIPFNIAHRMGLSRVNMDKAKRDFEKFLIENPEYQNKVTFEDYLEVKQGQINAFVSQLRVILGLLGLTAYLGFKGDDDDEPRYYQNWVTRNAYKIMAKAASEISFAWNPIEFINLVQNPIPITSLLNTAQKLVVNTFDETRDIIVGENSSQDKSPLFYYTLQFTYGGTQIARFFELFEEYKKSPY